MSDVDLPARMQCPKCPYTVVCSEEDPDAGMGNLWNHLYWDHALGSVANPRAHRHAACQGEGRAAVKLSYAYLAENPEWAPLTAALQAGANAAYAERDAAEERFRALFTPPAAARRERLAELDALTDQIGPLLDRLDATWRAVETDLGWHGRRRAVP